MISGSSFCHAATPETTRSASAPAAGGTLAVVLGLLFRPRGKPGDDLLVEVPGSRRHLVAVHRTAELEAEEPIGFRKCVGEPCAGGADTAGCAAPPEGG